MYYCFFYTTHRTILLHIHIIHVHYNIIHIHVYIGKIYVESESSKLHLILSQIYEKNGDLTTACNLIQDVHVETYGSLTKKEKAEYILFQISINLKCKDYIRALIQSRKMNRKVECIVLSYICMCIVARVYIYSHST